MIDGLLAHQALIREIINGVAFILLSTLVVMITIFLWDTWAKEGPMPYAKWSQFPGVPTACCLWWIFSAEAYRTCNVWVTYNLAKVEHKASLGESLGVGIFSSSSVSSTLGYLLAGIVLNVWLIRSIYIWTPPEWSGIWIYAACGAFIFVSIPTLML
jgi:hypothetical protein